MICHKHRCPRIVRTGNVIDIQKQNSELICSTPIINGNVHNLLHIGDVKKAGVDVNSLWTVDAILYGDKD